jgi:hypothetical protein
MNKLRIKKLGVLSVAKMYAAIMLVVSLLISIPYGLIIIAYSLFGASMMSGNASLAVGGGGVVFGVIVMVGLPIIYSLMGFVGGALGALLYNLFANYVGGIEIEVENVVCRKSDCPYPIDRPGRCTYGQDRRDQKAPGLCRDSRGQGARARSHCTPVSSFWHVRRM